MRYVADQMRARGEGKYRPDEWVPVAVEMSRPEPPRPGTVIERLKGLGAFEVVS